VPTSGSKTANARPHSTSSFKNTGIAGTGLADSKASQEEIINKLLKARSDPNERDGLSKAEG